MLFNSKVTIETEKTLEDLLFQDEEEETPRLPKTSVESFQGSVTTTVSSSSEKKPTEKSVEIQATFNVTEAEYQLMNDEPFEYIESNVEEDAKYLESAIGLPEYDQGMLSILFVKTQFEVLNSLFQSLLKPMKCTMKMLLILMNYWLEHKDPKKRIQDP